MRRFFRRRRQIRCLACNWCPHIGKAASVGDCLRWGRAHVSFFPEHLVVVSWLDVNSTVSTKGVVHLTPTEERTLLAASK